MLEQVTIKNYRSIQDATIRLGQLNVLVGPNGSGKSNILSVFPILRDYARRGHQALSELSTTLGLVGAADRRTSATIGFQLRGTILDSKETVRKFEYSLELASAHASVLQVTRERFGFTDKESPALIDYPQAQNPSMIQIHDEDKNHAIAIGVGGGLSPLGFVAQQTGSGWEDSALARFAREVLDWELLSPSPRFSKQAEPAKREVRLDEEGTNLSTVLHSIYSEDYEAFSRIVSSLQAAIPEIKSVQVPVTSEGQTFVEVQEKGVRKPIPIWALSDGTISLLQLFTLLENPKRPGVICIEEPENYVHPGLIENVIDALRRASETTQLLVATHSPFLLNKLRPEEVLVVEKTEGSTSVKTASDEAGVIEASKKLTLGEIWTSGAIGGVP